MEGIVSPPFLHRGWSAMSDANKSSKRTRPGSLTEPVRANDLRQQRDRVDAPARYPLVLPRSSSLCSFVLPAARNQRREADLARSALGERWHAVAFEHVSTGLVTLDRRGRVLDANRAAVRMLSASQAALQGAFLRTYVVPADKGIFLQHLQETFSRLD